MDALRWAQPSTAMLQAIAIFVPRFGRGRFLRRMARQVLDQRFDVREFATARGLSLESKRWQRAAEHTALPTLRARDFLHKHPRRRDREILWRMQR